MFKLKYNPANKPKITIPKKDRAPLVMLAFFFFSIGPLQTIGLIVSGDPQFKEALESGEADLHLVDNSLGSFGLWLFTYIALRFYRSGEMTRALESLVVKFQRDKDPSDF